MAFHHYNIGQERSVSPTGNNLITDLLKHARNIAVVGLSSSPLRPSHGVAAYMQTQGYRIIPVNPTIEEALGEKSYPSLLDVPEKIDIVCRLLLEKKKQAPCARPLGYPPSVRAHLQLPLVTAQSLTPLRPRYSA